jgi:uncharacterized protein YwgA
MADLSDLIMLLIDANGRRIEGRTVIQKQIYFYSQFYKKKIDFVSGYYGPYSRSVSRALAVLVEMRFVKEVIERLPAYGIQSEFDPHKYTYTVTEGGKKVLEQIKQKNPQETQEVKKFVDMLNETGAVRTY